MLDNNDFALASADDTSVVVLEKLSSHPQPEVREAVAKNPNTPTKVLLKLGKEFPDAITANPVFNLLLLENPESHFVRLSLARSTTTSEDMIAGLSKIEDEEILCAVAGNPKTPFHILEELVENPPLYRDRLFIAITQNPNTSESLLLQLAEYPSLYVRMAIANNPKTPLSLLNKFADGGYWMHQTIAKNPQAPSAILEKLAGENVKEIRDLVKNHPNVSETAIAIINFIEGKHGTSINLLERLASDRRAFVRRLVAAHPSTPVKVLENLAQDTDKYVSFKAASNPNATSTVLEFFVDNDDLARLVAANPLSESSLLGELFIKARINKDVEMQRALASNPNTPTQWLIGLAYLFPEEFFSNPAYDLSILENHRFGQKLLLHLVCASNAPTSFLEFAADICETNIKRIRNDEFFQKYQSYFKDFWKWREILIVIASQQNTSRKKLLELSTSGEDIVAEVAKLRLDCPNNNMNFWDEVALNKKPNLILFIPHILMFKLAQLPEISTNFLKAASELEKFPGILNIIANHPKTPKEVLDKLAKNSIPFIAEAAKLHINYAGELETGWRDVAEEKIDRAQLSIATDNEEGIELQLWQVGAIDESTLPYLNQKLVHEYTSTLLKIVSSTDTPRQILDNLENHPRVSQLIAECVTYLKQREAIVFDLFPQRLPIDDYHSTNQLNPVVTDLDTLFTKLKDKYWCKKIRYIPTIYNPTIHLRLLYLVQEFMGWRRRYYLRNMLMDFEQGRDKENKSILMRFSNLEYCGVILANSPSTSPQILSKLVEHPIQGVRVLVSSNYNISQNSLNKLIDDRHPEVRTAALANPRLDSILREQLATLENPNLSSLDLLELANSKHTAVRAKVVRHPQVDGSILTKLADDKLIVKLAVAKHPKTPAEILTRFTKHPDRRLPLAVAQNPDAPKDLLIQLATQPAKCAGFHFNPLNLAAVKSLLIQEPEAAIPFLDRCLKFPERPSFSRFLVLMNPRIPSSFLARYYKSWFWPERYAIAQNPNTDPDIIEQLTQDPNSIVRAAARDSLK